MNIQALLDNDIPFIVDLIPPGWDTALPAIGSYTKSNFCFPFKIMSNSKIAATGTCIIHKGVAWLAHIIVHQDFRNQGMGKLITEHLVETAYSKGCDTIYLLATELGEPVYRKIGFETESEYALYKVNRVNVPLTYSENIVHFRSEFFEEIANLDLQVSGEDRMFHLEKFLSTGFVYLVDNKLIGYYLPHFGDGLVITNDAIAGIELMKLRLTTKDNAAFPVNNLIASDFMEQYNFSADRTQKRMRLGKERNWQATNIYNRIGGNLG